MQINLNLLNEEERKSLWSIAKALSYFARVRAYGYVDRLANVFSTISLRQVLSEAIRELKSEYDRGEQIYMPTALDVELFIKIAEKDLSIARVVASLALAYSWGRLPEERKEEGIDSG